MNFQSIDPIQKLWSSSLTADSTEKANDSQAAGSLFSDVFQSLLDNVKETDATKNEKEYLLATGQLDNPAEMTIASSQYEASVALLVQVRNKALDAYSELIRMSV